MPRRMFSRCLLALAFLPTLVLPGHPADAASLAEPGRQPGELARIQMHSNRLRGVHYLPTDLDDGRPEPGQFTLRPVRNIGLDGDPELNVRGNVYPIDVDGDGVFELLHFNGYRVMRVYNAAGAKLWQVNNASGRIHRNRSHRDTIAVFATDGDGGQDIVHCWSSPSNTNKLLVVRDGRTGDVLKQVAVAGQGAREECHIAAFRIAGQSEPYVFLDGKAPSSGCANGNFTPIFPRTIVYDSDLTKLWERTTCGAGHYAWPLDANGDGLAESVFVGKYLLRPDGSTRCVLQGFGNDHVDSMVVANLDPGRTGLEVLTVGSSGTRFHQASSCRLRWTIPKGTINNAQQAAATLLDPDAAAPSMLVTTKLYNTDGGPVENPLRGYTVDTQGRVVGSYSEFVEQFAVPIQNANLDGLPGAEDRLVTFGQVVSGAGQRRLTTNWYWDLQTLSPAEEALDPQDKWTRSPFAFDMNNDGRDELIVWGRHKLIVGTRN